ncbi:hypothetical protein EX30DRAFT_361359 [Ascodesmis nigricans]|uniref:Uncharacterized protein n=1 Tax=Ascodesmis nigricans TaxID=341454 RepID=A0A4S2N826_9PEZI|nr:hypothetical protein EX30DRAFT_361359 [Ascodesmis nigricans]
MSCSTANLPREQSPLGFRYNCTFTSSFEITIEELTSNPNRDDNREIQELRDILHEMLCHEYDDVLFGQPTRDAIGREYENELPGQLSHDVRRQGPVKSLLHVPPRDVRRENVQSLLEQPFNEVRREKNQQRPLGQPSYQARRERTEVMARPSRWRNLVQRIRRHLVTGDRQERENNAASTNGNYWNVNMPPDGEGWNSFDPNGETEARLGRTDGRISRLGWRWRRGSRRM